MIDRETADECVALIAVIVSGLGTDLEDHATALQCGIPVSALDCVAELRVRTAVAGLLIEAMNVIIWASGASVGEAPSVRRSGGGPRRPTRQS